MVTVPATATTKILTTYRLAIAVSLVKVRNYRYENQIFARLYPVVTYELKILQTRRHPTPLKKNWMGALCLLRMG